LVVAKVKLDVDTCTCVPIPVKLIDCGLAPPLSVIATVPVRVLIAFGWKVTLTVQLAPTAIELPQVFVSLKSDVSVPPIAKLVTVTVEPPTFLTVTVCAALVAPRTVIGNVKLDVDRLISLMPVPVRLIDCGLPLALSVILAAPLRVPVAEGLNVMLIVQLALAASVVPHVLVCKKSPLIAMLVMLRVAVPVFLRVTLWAALVVPTAWLVKVRLVADKLTAGALAAVPVPVRLIVCGLPDALSVMVTVPVRVPVAVGLKVTLILQFPPAATEVPHVFVCA
jgi:hypothetical protein